MRALAGLSSPPALAMAFSILPTWLITKLSETRYWDL
jgi:hypothetical protein